MKSRRGGTSQDILGNKRKSGKNGAALIIGLVEGYRDGSGRAGGGEGR